MSPGPPAPFLLTAADHYGTLAAARCLGRAGIPVAMADRKRIAPAVWSRYVTRRARCPRIEETESFVAWLLAFGSRHPGHVLYPTNDDLAFVLSLHRDALAERFLVAFPPLHVVYPLLDKSRLYPLAREVGFDVPRTIAPADTAEAERLARDLGGPLVLKPRTQALLRGHPKGVRLDKPAEVGPAYREFERSLRYSASVLLHDPAAARPLVQEYLPTQGGIYSVGGFAPQDGSAPVLRASTKVLQSPRRLGNGICFAHAEVDARVASRLGALMRRVGYHGAFEAEVIRHGGREILIDFNPRFYGEMGFDIARGLSTPLLVHHQAVGDAAAFRAALRRAEVPVDGLPAYVHRLELQLMVTAQRLSGMISREEAIAWKRWGANGSALDAVDDPGDRLPYVAEVVQRLLLYASHPGYFVRHVLLDR